MTPIITFGLILAIELFNKIDMNPAQVKVAYLLIKLVSESEPLCNFV